MLVLELYEYNQHEHAGNPDPMQMFTLGSEMPRVWTSITRCKNLTAENRTPLLAVGAQTNSIMRALHVERVFHAAGLLWLVQLCDG